MLCLALLNTKTIFTICNIFTGNFQTVFEKNLEEELLKLYHYHYDKYREDWANMKLEFKKQTEDIEISSEQYSQFQQEHDKKIHLLKTEFKQKLGKKKDNLIEVSKKNRECCICLGTLYCDDAKPAKPLLCAHDAFHEHCIKRWVETTKTCPECRSPCTITEQNCYTFNTFATIEPISNPKLLDPFISLDSLESISIKFLTDEECRRFLPENTDQYHKEIMCVDTNNLENSLRPFEQYKVSQL